MTHIRNRFQERTGMFVAVICMLFSVGIIFTEKIEGFTYDDAYAFYTKYGNGITFLSTSSTDGDIYCVTREESASASIEYTNLGWKVSVLNSSKTVVDTIYYALDGAYMVQVDTCTEDGYVYTLYKIPLSNVKERISENARNVLATADCNILFDACITTCINGIPQGEMTDTGSGGKHVYTTYEEIVHAQDWTDTSKETLKTFYDKEVTDLFYTITVDASVGIESVSGGGRYCYGTTITISAKPADGYMFHRWRGTDKKEAEFSYVVESRDNLFGAYAKRMYVNVHFYTGMETDGEPTETISYTYNTPGQVLPDFQWKKEGHHQIGWSETPNAAAVQYSMNNGVTQSWLESKYPEVNLYAVWEPNTYHIHFHANGGTGSIDPITVKYPDQLTLPSDGFQKSGSNLSGWGITKYSQDYTLGRVIEVADLVNQLNLQYSDNVDVEIYAMWGNGPVIYGSRIYVSLEDAKNGLVTESWLSGYVYAVDREDGYITYGQNESNSFLIIDYDPSDFTGFEKGGYVTETFRAVDSNGNVRKKTIPVYIIDTPLYDYSEINGETRFISREYYKDEEGSFLPEEYGGLLPMSIWRHDEEYSSILDSLFQLD